MLLDYSQTLRVIGQALESFEAQAFDIVCYGNCYLVRCLTKQGQKTWGALPKILRIWKTEDRQFTGLRPWPPMNVELLYSLNDIDVLDLEGKAKRSDPKGMPDPYSVSNILRSVGGDIADKGKVRLLLTSSHNHRVVTLYETAQGVRRLEEYELSSFYDLWVKTYVKKRQERSRPA
jgi:hypothetical protein